MLTGQENDPKKQPEDLCVIIDNDQRARNPFVYVSGDVAKAFAHEIVTTVHKEATVDITAYYDLNLQRRRMIDKLS